jgi:hypothetical protein
LLEATTLTLFYEIKTAREKQILNSCLVQIFYAIIAFAAAVGHNTKYSLYLFMQCSPD